MWDVIRQELLYSIRNLRKHRSYSIIVVLTLALATGGSAAVFSVVNAVLIRSLPYRSPEMLVMVWNRYGKMKETRAHVSPPDFLDRKRESRTVENMAAIEETNVNWIGKGEPARIRAARVSASLFQTLGVTPVKGRDFQQEEDRPGRNSVVIVSHNFWKRHFGAEQGLIGQTLNLSGTQHVVIGIMPEFFWFPTPEVDMWMPIAFTAEQLADDFRGNEYLTMIARVKSEVSIQQVRTEMNNVAATVLVRVPARREFLSSSGWGAIVTPLRESITGEVEPALLILMGAVTFLLLIGCVNVANLILARTGSREKELAVRAVLGAGRMKLIRLLFVEAFVLSISGGILGLLLAYWATSVLPAIAPEGLPRLSEISIDRSVLGFSLIASVLTGLLIGIVPAFKISMFRPFQSLKLEGTSTPSKSIHRFRNALVITEIALALVLAIGAALLTKSFQKLISINPGFRTEERLTFTLSLPPKQYSESHQIVNFYQTLLQNLQSLPGVNAVGANANLPMVNHNWTATFSIEERPLQPGEPALGFEYRMVTPNYFRAMGIPFRMGRDFSESDTQDTNRVAIIDENMANRFWKNQSPIGKKIGFSNSYGVRWREVIGVVGHVKNSSLKEVGAEQVYFPHSQLSEPAMTVVIYATGDSARLMGLVRDRVRLLDPVLPIYQITTLDRILSGSVAQPRFNMLLFLLFAITALALASVGIYGVLSYTVTQRKKEIGIRMALGASPDSVLIMVLRQSMMISVAGLFTGVVASLALSRFLQSLLFKMPSVDAVIYSATAAFALFVALLASFLPARRAAKVDPLRTLRDQ